MVGPLAAVPKTPFFALVEEGVFLSMSGATPKI
ncbi:hypothetical protein Dret_1454 [Desulfohalobium retbaense DSM 5692]|uniref:Uncharacterized protein n=1 Tax=Desulfohalobium retbaense (strain ATCC 49708 / DSM 5692 / JCM 16813 / HR100) TaxID=485915 RepID=C8X2U4_DESRD|nr:hypothetical protein Dret_1454 [Desulfohalobium retbaense DSM 5692]